MFACTERAHKQGRGVIALGILLMCCPCASALDPSLDISQYAHTAWTVREGFSKGTITSIAQTPDGYLWLGTEFDLLRFDGVRIVPWQPPAGEHLPSSDIHGLLVSRNGTLWIGTAKGLASWKDGELTLHPELAGQAVEDLLEDREGTVWAGGQAAPTGRLCAIRSSSFQCYGEDGSFGRYVKVLYQDSGGNLWVGGMTGLWRWKPGPPKLYPMPDTVQALIEGDNGALLIAMRSGMRQLVDGRVEAYPLPATTREFNPYRLLRDRNGGLWIGTTDRGLVHVRQRRADVFARPDGLSGDFIERLFEDREGDIWVATLDGLDRFRGLAVPTISVKQGLSNATVESVLAARDGSVWLGTVDGLNRWNNGQIMIYRKRSAPAMSSGARREEESGGLGAASESGALGEVTEITSSGLPDDAIESLFQDDRRIWVSTRRGAAYLEDGRFIPVGAVPGGVHFILGDSAGNLWMSQDQSLFHLLGGSVVERIPWTSLGHKDAASALAADPLQGGLWLGFRDGGVEYFKGGKVRASYAAADGLGKGHVRGLHLDRDGALWAAIEGGLSRVKDGRVATLTSKNGLPCDAVHWVMEDDAHSFWLCMACGLVRIARPELDAWATHPQRTIQATVFDSSDGVRSHATTTGYSPSVAKSADGKLWFLPWDGVSIIDPPHLSVNQLPPPVHIEQVIADRKTYEASSHLRLPPLVRDLEIDYTALSLVAPEKVLFRFKLEGRDRDWQDVGNRRQAFYNNLSPGNYRFRVTACNNSGVWNEAGASLDFSIAPAYYQTLWFRVTCVAAFLALLWALYQLRLRSIKQRSQQLVLMNTQLEAQIAERKRAEEALSQAQAELARVNRVILVGETAASIAHEVNQPIAATVTNASAGLRWLAAQPPDMEEVRQALGRIIKDGNRAGEVIARIRALVKKSPPRKDWLDINETIQEVVFLTGSEVHKSGISLQTQLSNDLPPILADRIQLQQVILNLIKNAVEAMSTVSDAPRELLVSSGKDESKGVLVAVRDSGPGLDPEAVAHLFDTFYTTKPQGMGMGLAISRSIIEAHGGRLWATPNEPHGAVFQFTLPADGNRMP
jgi:signal transduction histidine kinase/ligand-binding sensor domain-containing protein